MKKIQVEIKLSIGVDDDTPELNKMRARAMMYEIIDVINAGEDSVVPNSCVSIRHGVEVSDSMGWSMFAEDWDMSGKVDEVGDTRSIWSEESLGDGSREWNGREEIKRTSFLFPGEKANE